MKDARPEQSTVQRACSGQLISIAEDIEIARLRESSLRTCFKLLEGYPTMELRCTMLGVSTRQDRYYRCIMNG